MIEYNNVYDISVLLGEKSIDYPGDTPYSRESLSTIDEGGVYELSKLTLSAHSGTHLDTPAHFFANGKTVDQYKIENFIFSALVVDIKNETAVTSAHLADVAVKPGDALLLRTDNSTSGRCRSGVFSEQLVYLTKGAAEVCVEKKVALVGIDSITVEQFGNDAFDVHRTLLAAGVLVLESIDLNHIFAGKYMLYCLPLKMKGAEASPVRAILMD